ncbi:Putative CRISPR type III-B/RAMP module RAMP protein Cmr3 [Desulfonema limicola]|uniref:CRISPR type III-B/RAMP module RAMP protein Cmr3 n=1 Tax=Desulfonema limicola TaxID=45656 RepID=A0A975B7F3_9BACT|nr:type III-B CRISPR module-associated protein Cmr3 [Desulfonema limicola]QTA80260.1 Putative CRISPR type III-B/RAMP module RAMP protein Cmr3 [Desulfonema limicola]
MWIFIKPVDTVCCRDGRPFGLGENVSAKTLFPPMPSTFYGAIRSAILAENNKSFKDFHKQKHPYPDLAEVGTTSELGTLKISGPWLAKKNESLESFEHFFPSPVNLAQDKEDESVLYKLIPEKDSLMLNSFSDLKIPLLAIQGPENKIVKSIGGYLNISGAGKMLMRDDEIPEKNKDYCSSEKLYKMSWQVGLKRTFKARTAEEGHLYSIGHYRMSSKTDESSGFMIKVQDADNLPKQGMLRLGGESRAAIYEKVSWVPFQDHDFNQIVDLIVEKQRFFLWLLTPAIPERNFLPFSVNPPEMSLAMKGLKVKLTACQLGTKEVIGGFKFGQYSGGASKASFRAVPSGSVYFFEIEEKTDKNAIDKFVRTQMFDTLDCQIKDMANQGFGTTLIGGY